MEVDVEPENNNIWILIGNKEQFLSNIIFIVGNSSSWQLRTAYIEDLRPALNKNSLDNMTEINIFQSWFHFGQVAFQVFVNLVFAKAWASSAHIGKQYTNSSDHSGNWSDHFALQK
ncbi:hypothetical protein BpHYR1_025871, partial [Brachionus plicatilis]